MTALEDLRQKIREWICPFDVEVSHRKARSVCQAGTGSWFIDGPFQRWFRGQEKSRLLYLEGKCKLWLSDVSLNLRTYKEFSWVWENGPLVCSIMELCLVLYSR